MNTLWTFGDSFTAGNGCLDNEEYPIKYKKNENDLIWVDKISEILNFKLMNYGVGLYSNDKILDSIIKNYHFIDSSDIVIIGTTFYSRFDVPHNNRFLTLSATTHPNEKDEILCKMIVMMNSELLKTRQLDRILFFVNLFKKRGIKCLLWEVENQWDQYESIKTASLGSIDDLHWSYKGHSDFSNYILNKMERRSKIL